jgi:hypothetical protein
MYNKHGRVVIRMQTIQYCTTSVKVYLGDNNINKQQYPRGPFLFIWGGPYLHTTLYTL